MINIKRKTWLALATWFSIFFFIFNMLNYIMPWKLALIKATFELVIIMSMYFITSYYLFPKFYESNKKYLYISIVVILVLTLVYSLIFIYFIPEFSEPNHERPPVIFLYFRFFFTLGFSYLIGTSVSFMEKTNKLRENEKVLIEEKLETELKLLKAQINPHFIFNALNNIYSLSYMQSQKAPDSILKLSEMLRYVFYDCSKDRVPLSAEMKYVENFISFQQMKSDHQQNIILASNLDASAIEVAPMLMVPFIENAFKYSRIEELDEAYVKMKISKSDSKIIFSVENSVPLNSKSGPGSGMGIANVKHRLQIIYPDNHELKVVDNEEVFKVILSLEV